MNDLQRDNHALRSRISHLEAFGPAGPRAMSAGSASGASVRPPRPSTGSLMKLLSGPSRASVSPGSPPREEGSAMSLGDGPVEGLPRVSFAGIKLGEGWEERPSTAVRLRLQHVSQNIMIRVLFNRCIMIRVLFN